MTLQGLRRAWRLLLALALLAAGSSAAWADPPGRVGRLAQAGGTVWMFDTEAGDWAAVSVNRPVTTGDRLATDHGARADIQVGSASVRLDGATELLVQQLDDQRVSLLLERGSIALRVRAADGADDFEIVANDARFQPTRAGQYRVDLRDNVATVLAWSGQMRFQATDSSLLLEPGTRYSFWVQDDRTHYDMAAARGEDAFGAWVLAQDQREDRSASTHYVSPEMTGALDLDRHGRWDSHPEYGAVWFPVGVPATWAPYRYGHWSWVAPWGWTWVDDAPWGFAPFHYGRWASWRGRWCWVPGRYVPRPVYAPALVGWIGGSSFNVNVNIVGGARPAPPLIGWVPLGPRDAYVPRFNATPRHIWGVNAPVGAWLPPPGAAPRHWDNRGVQGAVTVVPADTLIDRRRVADRVLPRVEPRWNAALPTQQPALPRPDRPDRPDRFERPDRPDRPDRVERPGRPDGRDQRGAGTGAVNVPGALVPPPPSIARPGAPGVVATNPNVVTPGTAAPPQPPGRGVVTLPGGVRERPDRPDWSDRPDRPDRPGRPERPDRVNRLDRNEPPGGIGTRPGGIDAPPSAGPATAFPGPRERPQPPGVVATEPGVARPPLQRAPGLQAQEPGMPPRIGRDQIPPAQRAAPLPPDFNNARSPMPTIPGDRVPPEGRRVERPVPVMPQAPAAPPMPAQPRPMPQPPSPAAPPRPQMQAPPPAIQSPAAPGGGGPAPGRVWHGGQNVQGGGGPRER